MRQVRALTGLAAGGSAALLAGALAFQHFGGLAPCEMCIWQRWPHLAAVAIGALALALPRIWLLLAGMLAAAVTAGIGLLHMGVEYGWWEGPTTCSAPIGQGGDALFAQIMNAPLVRCDQVAWQMGLSMAGWNMVLSLGLALIWLVASLRLMRR